MEREWEGGLPTCPAAAVAAAAAAAAAVAEIQGSRWDWGTITKHKPPITENNTPTSRTTSVLFSFVLSEAGRLISPLSEQLKQAVFS